jgi:hypothetical protein
MAAQSDVSAALSLYFRRKQNGSRRRQIWRRQYPHRRRAAASIARGVAPLRPTRRRQLRRRRQSGCPSRKPIVMGSHIDSVPSAGNFDGDVGNGADVLLRTALRVDQASRDASASL